MITRSLQQIMIDAFHGTIAGDSFGVGIEFKSRHWIKPNVHFDQFLNLWKDGKNNISPGTYSDDGEHTIGLVEALLSDEPFSEELLLKMWKREYDNDKARKGFPRDGHGSIEHWYKGDKTIEEVRKEQASRDDPGNGPVMRAVPLAFIKKELIYPYSIINADATHPHFMARYGTLIVALAGWHFLRSNGTKEELMRFLHDYIGDVTVQGYLSVIDALPAPDQLTEEDYLTLHGQQPLPYIKWDPNIYGLPCAAMKTALNAVYVLKHATDAFDALKISIRMGGDVDSLAAVCTGIAAGAYGIDSLPEFLIQQTEGWDRMEALAIKLHDKLVAES